MWNAGLRPLAGTLVTGEGSVLKEYIRFQRLGNFGATYSLNPSCFGCGSRSEPLVAYLHSPTMGDSRACFSYKPVNYSWDLTGRLITIIRKSLFLD